MSSSHEAVFTPGPVSTCPTRFRNGLGYTASTVKAVYGPVGVPVQKVPGLPCGSTSAPEVVDNLTVQRTLTAQNIVGGTLLLTGSTVQTTSGRLAENALTVLAGAKFDGTTTHGAITVTGPARIGGPLTVSDIVGPVRIAQATTAQASTLTVSGSTTMDALDALALTATDFATETAYIDGYNAAPLAMSSSFSVFSNAIFTVVKRLGSGPYTYTTTVGVALQTPDKSTRLLTCGISDYTTPTLYTTADTVTVVSAQGDVYAAQVAAVSVSGSVAVLAPAPGATDFGKAGLTPLTVAASDAEGDMVAVGTPVWIPRYDVVSGSFGFATGTVSSPSIQLLDSFSSVAITLTAGTAPLTKEDMGAPIFVASTYTSTEAGASSFRVLGLLQHGCPDAVTAFGGSSAPLGAIVGGIRARYLEFLLQAADDAGPSPYNLPAMYDSTPTLLAAGAVTAIQRASITNLRPGGVMKSGALTTAGQLLSTLFVQSLSPLIQVPTVLGAQGPNYPSVTDVALDVYTTHGGTATPVYYSTAAGSTDGASGTPSILGAGLYIPPNSNGLQAYIRTGTMVSGGTIPPFPGLQLNPAAIYSTATPPAFLYGISDLQLNLSRTTTPSASAGTVAVVTIGSNFLTATSLFSAVAFYGSYTAVNNFITSPDGPLRYTRIYNAWTLHLPAVPANPDTLLIAALCGIQSSGYVFATVGSSTAPYVSASTSVAFEATGAGTGQVTVTLQATPSTTLTFTNAVVFAPYIDRFSVYVPHVPGNFTGFDTNIIHDVATVEYSGVAASTGSVALNTAAPSPMS